MIFDISKSLSYENGEKFITSQKCHQTSRFFFLAARKSVSLHPGQIYPEEIISSEHHTALWV